MRSGTAHSAADDLQQALADLDRAFGPRTGRTARVEGCGHCFGEADFEALAGPAAAIDGDALFRAVFKWGGTLDASVDWLRWITPRLVRELVEDRALLDGEMIACRLAAAGWRDWPAGERQALENLCRAWWRAVLAAPGADADRNSAIAALVFLITLTGEVEPWLAIWSATPGRTADLLVRDLWLRHDDALLAGDLDVAVYAPGPNIAPELAAWLIDHGARRLAEGDLDELSAWKLAQLPLPPEERWR